MNRPSGRPLHRPSAGPPPPPLRGMGGITALQLTAASSSTAKRGRGTMRSMVEGAATPRFSRFGAL
jgi:hypothetical protein